MKKIYTLKTLLYLGFFSLLFACKKNDNPIDWKDPIFTQGNLVTASFTGRITDNDNYPLSGATVTVGGKTTTTDVNGQFNIANALVSSNAALIKVAKNGFFTGYRTLVVKAGAIYRVELVMIAKGNSQTFSATSGGTVNMGNGCNIQFPASSMVVQSSGAAYNGAVTVSAFFLNPADSNFNSYMPGDLRGVNSNNNEQLLQSYGMVVAELQGSSGEKLQLAPGKRANITLPIAAALQASAPDSIPLWHFDETIGIWKEEGKATKQGNAYVGTVSHFSFWNWDVPYSLVNYSATLKDQHGNPLSYTLVKLKRPNGEERSDYTDNEGTLNALIPYEEPLLMTILNNCSTVLLIKNLGPSRTDVNEGTITVSTLNSISSAIVTGKVVGCTGFPVSAGYVEMKIGSKILHAPVLSGGNFTIGPDECNVGHTATIFAYDSSTGFRSPPVTITSATGNIINVGELTITCSNNSAGFINMSISGTPYSWVSSSSDSLYCRLTYDPIMNFHKVDCFCESIPFSSNLPYISFVFDKYQTGPPSTGSYGVRLFQYYPNGTSNPTTSYFIHASSVGLASVNVSELGPVGGYITGVMSFDVDQLGPSGGGRMECSFKMRRIL